jgi:hypothetical protein
MTASLLSNELVRRGEKSFRAKSLKVDTTVDSDTGISAIGVSAYSLLACAVSPCRSNRTQSGYTVATTTQHRHQAAQRKVQPTAYALSDSPGTAIHAVTPHNTAATLDALA